MVELFQHPLLVYILSGFPDPASSPTRLVNPGSQASAPRLVLEISDLEVSSQEEPAAISQCQSPLTGCHRDGARKVQPGSGPLAGHLKGLGDGFVVGCSPFEDNRFVFEVGNPLRSRDGSSASCQDFFQVSLIQLSSMK